MAVLGSNLQKLEVSNLLTPEYSSSTGSCLQFWYACVDIILYWSIMDPVFVFKLCSNPVESNVLIKAVFVGIGCLQAQVVHSQCMFF